MVYGLRAGRGSEEAANQTNKLARRLFTSVLLEELGNVEFGDATVTGALFRPSSRLLSELHHSPELLGVSDGLSRWVDPGCASAAARRRSSL